MTSTKPTPAEAIKHQRLLTRRFMKDVAKDAGMSRTILGRIEAGKQDVSYTQMLLLARALDIPFSVTFGSTVISNNIKTK